MCPRSLNSRLQYSWYTYQFPLSKCLLCGLISAGIHSSLPCIMHTGTLVVPSPTHFIDGQEVNTAVCFGLGLRPGLVGVWLSLIFDLNNILRAVLYRMTDFELLCLDGIARTSRKALGGSCDTPCAFVCLCVWVSAKNKSEYIISINRIVGVCPMTQWLDTGFSKHLSVTFLAMQMTTLWLVMTWVLRSYWKTKWCAI